MNINNTDFLEDFKNKVAAERGNSKYDILVPVSGGKDGSYLLWYLSKYTNLRILAFHIDNWYVTDSARKNVEKICKDLGCDLTIIRPDWNHAKDAYKNLLMLNGEICMACEMMISLYPFEYAVSYQIPYIAWGLTPNQIKSKKINSGYLTSDYEYYNNIVKFYSEMFDSLYKSDEAHRDEVKEALLYNHTMDNTKKFPTFVMPFYWLGYDAGEVEETVTKELGWVRPLDAGGTSSNCLINKLHIYIKKEIKGEEFYRKMMEKKSDVNEVIGSVKDKALTETVDHDFNKKILDELGINMTEEQLIENVKNSKKDLIMKLGSNISQ